MLKEPLDGPVRDYIS